MPRNPQIQLPHADAGRLRQCDIFKTNHEPWCVVHLTDTGVWTLAECRRMASGIWSQTDDAELTAGSKAALIAKAKPYFKGLRVATKAERDNPSPSMTPWMAKIRRAGRVNPGRRRNPADPVALAIADATKILGRKPRMGTAR